MSTVLTGLVPIFGMLKLGWSASQLVLFLLAGAWIGIVCDFIKLWLLYEPIMKTAKAFYDDWHVWVVVEAKRNGGNKAPRDHLGAAYSPGSGVLVDLTFGTLSTAIIWISMTHVSDEFGLAQAKQSGLLYGLIGLAAYRAFFTAWEIASCRIGAGRDRAVKVAVGLRGVGLFLLMFVVLMVIGDEDGPTHADGTDAVARIVMFVVNGAILAFGLVTACSPWFFRGETVWLRRYLEEQNSGAAPRQTIG